MDKALFTYKQLWGKPIIQIFPNRIEYRLGFSNKVIPISNISDIEQSVITKTVKLNLNNGKSITLLIPWNKSDELVNTLNSLLQH